MANLCGELFRLFSLGQLAATEVQALVLAAAKDGWGKDFAVSRQLIKAASNKTGMHNASRNVFLAARSFVDDRSKVQPYFVDVGEGFMMPMS